MSVERVPEGRRARCDRCGLATPKIEAVNDETVTQILRAAGWQTPDLQTSYCPRCRGLTAPYSVATADK